MVQKSKHGLLNTSTHGVTVHITISLQFVDSLFFYWVLIASLIGSLWTIK